VLCDQVLLLPGEFIEFHLPLPGCSGICFYGTRTLSTSLLAPCPLLLPLPAGFPSSKTGAKGNLRLRFDIQFPRKQLSEAERQQLEAMLADKH
jgi:hypothetical protein